MEVFNVHTALDFKLKTFAIFYRLDIESQFVYNKKPFYIFNSDEKTRICVKDGCTMCTMYVVRTMYINKKHPSLLTSVSTLPTHARFMEKSNSEKNTD